MAPFLVAPNPGTVARTGQILIANQTLTITQSPGPAGTVTGYTESVYAGGGSTSVPNLGDGGPATNAYLSSPQGVAFDKATGNLYIADYGDAKIRVVTPDGNINTFAGGGSSTAENVPALSALLVYPQRVAVDFSSSVYFDDSANRVRKVSSGIVATFAGTTSSGFGGDNGPATSALLNGVLGIAPDSLGNVYIVDSSNNRIRKVSNGTITTFAGGGNSGLENGVPATSATLVDPTGVGVDSSQNVYIADYVDGLVREVSSGTINTFASVMFAADITTDLQGNVFVVSSTSIVRISSNGTMLTIPELYPIGVTTDSAGNLYFSEYYAGVVQKLTPIPTFCTYSIGNLPTGSIAGAGGTVTLSVTAAVGCNWTAYSNSSGATIASGSSGSANGSVSITFAANTTGSSRTLMLAIAGQAIDLIQLVDPPQLGFFILNPCRIADTRTGSGFSAEFGAPSLSP
jgi:hypothetical protein